MEENEEKIRESLIQQLKQQGKEVPYILSWVNDYVRHYNIKNMLYQDIMDRGVKIAYKTTKGYDSIKDNESNKSLQNEQKLMLDMLRGVGLQNPVEQKSMDDYM